ncbi:MAG: hypothetical protein QCH31_03160 [Methanolobus sp.]|nr:hypothetical protein [Methanolobus sp.]
MTSWITVASANEIKESKSTGYYASSDIIRLKYMGHRRWMGRNPCLCEMAGIYL